MTPARMFLEDKKESSIFCNERTVSKKLFDNFNDFIRDIELREFAKETFVPDTIEGFLHIKKDGGGVNVVVKVLAKLVCKLC